MVCHHEFPPWSLSCELGLFSRPPRPLNTQASGWRGFVFLMTADAHPEFSRTGKWERFTIGHTTQFSLPKFPDIQSILKPKGHRISHCDITPASDGGTNVEEMRDWMLFHNPMVATKKALDEFNRSRLDHVELIEGGEQGMKTLSEMNSLIDGHDEFVKSLAPKLELL